MTIKPIETEYDGHIFRSRLEARWAVFFNKVGIVYEYEIEGYENEARERYLPDMYLPEFKIYVEVKGNRPEAWDELIKAYHMMEWGGDIRRIAILSDMPKHYDDGIYFFPCYYWNGIEDRAMVSQFAFTYFGKIDLQFSDDALYNPQFQIINDKIVECHKEASFQAVSEGELYREYKNFEPWYKDDGVKWRGENNDVINNAFKEALYARFEFGETPKGDQR
jgi:hypothetical protein